MCRFGKRWPFFGSMMSIFKALIPDNGKGGNMAAENCHEAFRKSPLAAELTDEESNLVSEHLVCRKLKDGEILFREGDVDNNLYLIADGNLAVAHETPEGEWVVLHVLRTRDLAGEMGFLDGQKHTATLRSIGPTELISLERENLERP